MPIFRFILFFCLVSSFLLLTACASKKQIAVDYPVAETTTLSPLPGSTDIDGDDYYVQLVSDFNLKSGSALKSGCNELGGSYENGNLSAALVFAVSNDALKLKREASGFLYEATTGKCNFRLETKKAYLTPWMRLDAGMHTAVDYRFFTSTSSEANFSKLIQDVNVASSLLAFTGVGAGVAIIGNIANQWVQQKKAMTTPETKPPANARYSNETHTLPTPIAQLDKTVNLNHSRLTVYEVVESRTGILGAKQNVLGELNIYPIFSPSLLLKTSTSGLPDARELSLTDLWQSPIKSDTGEISLLDLIKQLKTQEPVNLKPNWNNHNESDKACSQLKRVLRELGFNKFDRNAVLYYFINQSSDWQSYNTPLQSMQSDKYSTSQLQGLHDKAYSVCLIEDDYQAMQRLGLAVNSEQDWNKVLSSGQQKESAFNSLHAIERQLPMLLKSNSIAESTQQLYPLLATANTPGSVLLQNHLGSFGLEALLQQPTLTKEGAVVSAEQLSQALAALAIENISCVRPAPDQDKFLPNIGILLFRSKPNTSGLTGGALEFEVNAGKVARITLQLPSYRDFEQSLLDHPSVGGCQIATDFLKERLPAVLPAQ